MPFGVDRECGDLLVAVSDPYQALDILTAFQARTSQRIRPYLAGRTALAEAIERHYFGQTTSMSSLANLTERGSQHGLRALEISSMGAVPGYGDSGMGAREPAPSLSQFGISLLGNGHSPAPAQTHPTSSSVDKFFADADPAAPLQPGWGAGGDILGAASHEPAEPVAGGATGAPLDALRRENAALRQQVERLEASLQLEINLVRQVVEMLLQSGAIDRQTYLDKMSKLR
jgi:hypothetical protein